MLRRLTTFRVSNPHQLTYLLVANSESLITSIITLRSLISLLSRSINSVLNMMFERVNLSTLLASIRLFLMMTNSSALNSNMITNIFSNLATSP